MERYAWRGRVKEGCIEEYKRRHAEIWPEMKAVLKEAGICKPSPSWSRSSGWTDPQAACDRINA